MNEISAKRVAMFAARYFSIPDSMMFSDRQFRRLTYARQIAAFVAVRRFGCKVVETAKALDRDHGTVVHGYQRIQSLYFHDAEVARHVDELTAAVFEPMPPAIPEPADEAKSLPAVPRRAMSLTRSSIESIDRYRSRGFSVARIAELTGIDEMTVASVCRVPMWRGKSVIRHEGAA